MKKFLVIIFYLTSLYILVACNTEAKQPIITPVEKYIQNESKSTQEVKLGDQKKKHNLTLIENIDKNIICSKEIITKNYTLKINSSVEINAQNNISKYRNLPFTQEEVDKYIKLFDKNNSLEKDMYVKVENVDVGLKFGMSGCMLITDDLLQPAFFNIGNYIDDKKQCGMISYNNIITPSNIIPLADNAESLVSLQNLLDSSWFDTKEKLESLVTISEKDAIKIANDFLSNLGIDTMEIATIELKPQIVSKENKSYYDIVYCNTLINSLNNGLFAPNEIVISTTMLPPTSKYVAEHIYIAVDERGIIGFSYGGKKEKIETLQEIIEVISFENALEIVNENIENELSNYPQNSEILIDKITLGTVYVPIDDQTMKSIPVWDFEGKVLTQEKGIKTGYALPHSIIRVNAIDGSIINRNLGY